MLPDVHDAVSPQWLLDLIESMWAADSDRRPLAEEVLQQLELHLSELRQQDDDDAV